MNYSYSKKYIVTGLVIFFLFSCKDNSEETKNTSERNGKVTYGSTISTILFKNCTPCHRSGEAGPFNLLTYADAKRNANKIKFVTQTHYMPPWPADANYTHFSNERVLSEYEINQIKNWVDDGCPAGDTSKIKAPSFYSGSFFGKPDLVIKMQEVIPIKGSGTDLFFLIKMPYELQHDTFVRFIEFVPCKKKLVHHVNGHLLSYSENKKKNVFEGKSFFLDILGGPQDVYKLLGLLNDDGTYPLLTPNAVYYLPGYTPPVYPENIGGYTLKKKGVFFLKNLHYGPSNADCVDSSKINIFFGSKPIRPIEEAQLGTFGIASIEPKFDIPANVVKTFMSRWTTPRDLSILSVNPHMHLLGKTFWAYALTPEGDTIRLIKIKKWDFKWQYFYTYKHPVKIPAGSTIYAFGTYDNTAKNPYNPFHPPREIKERNDLQSMSTTEEMFQFIFNYLPYKAGDERIDLENNKQTYKPEEKIKEKKEAADSLNKVSLTTDIKRMLNSYQKSLKIPVEVNNKRIIAYSLKNIGFIYNNQNDVKRALEYYSRSLNIYQEINDKEGVANSLNNIGKIYNNQGDRRQAMEYHERSLKIREQINDKKDIADSLNNLGSICNNKNEVKQALNYYQRSLKIYEEINDKKGINNLLNKIGAIYTNQADIKQAIEYRTRSLKLQEENSQRNVKIKEEINNPDGIAYSLNNIGTIYFKEKNYLLALLYEDSALTLAKEVDYLVTIRNAEGVLAKIDSAIAALPQISLGNKTEFLKGALAHYQQYIIFRDSISKQKLQTVVIEKRTDNKSISANEERNADNINKTILFIIIACGLFFVFAYVCVRIFRNKNK